MNYPTSAHASQQAPGNVCLLHVDPLVLDHIHCTLTPLLLTGFSNSSHNAGHNLPLFNPNTAGNLNPTPEGNPMTGLDLLAPVVAASLKPPKVTEVPFSKEITSPLQSSCLLATKEDSRVKIRGDVGDYYRQGSHSDPPPTCLPHLSHRGTYCTHAGICSADSCTCPHCIMAYLVRDGW